MNIAIFGSTGSVGRRALDVVRQSGGSLSAIALACHSNVELFAEQIAEFHPRVVAIYKEEFLEPLKKAVEKRQPNSDVIFLSGPQSWEQISGLPDVERILFASSGLTALPAMGKAIAAGKLLAVANKEVLVTDGKRLMENARKTGAQIIPVDSEHSAIFQCLQGEDPESIHKVFLACSGGPFLGYTREQLEKVTPEQALAHPTWKMGKHISIDSATLMNKGFEVIEAMNLFNLKEEQIEIVIHPESIFHSAIQFKDGSIKAQLGAPDMREPISYALHYPHRKATNEPMMSLLDIQKLTFQKPDLELFKGPSIVMEAYRHGPDALKKLILLNEQAVEDFLHEKISFLDIYRTLEETITQHLP